MAKEYSYDELFEGASGYTRNGGVYLAAARTWLQWHKHNGDRAIWGSLDTLKPEMTVADVEAVAKAVAEAVFKDLLAKWRPK